MHEIWPGWFANQPRSVNRDAPPLRLVKMKEDAYISGYEDGMKAGKKEFLKIAEGKLNGLPITRTILGQS